MRCTARCCLRTRSFPSRTLRLSVRPHIIGSPFGFLGPFTFETWITDTSGDVGISDSRFWGIIVAGFRPLQSGSEISAMELYQLGGTGVPAPLTWAIWRQC